MCTDFCRRFQKQMWRTLCRFIDYSHSYLCYTGVHDQRLLRLAAGYDPCDKAICSSL